MYSVNLNSHEISYISSREKINSELQTIIFIHGNSNSKEVFLELFKDLRLNKFNLIAFDLPGHGESKHIPSAKSNPYIYTIDFYGKTLNQFIDCIGVTRPHVFGHSLGAHITINAVKNSGQFASITNCQNAPVDRSDQFLENTSQDEVFSPFFSEKVGIESLRKLAPKLFKMTPPPSWFFDTFLKTDPLCRKNLISNLNSGAILDEIKIIQSLDVPFLLIIGEDDEFIRNQYLESLEIKDKIKMIPKCGHFPQIESPLKVLKIIELSIR